MIDLRKSGLLRRNELYFLLLSLISLFNPLAANTPDTLKVISVGIESRSSQQDVIRYAAKELMNGCRDLGGSGLAVEFNNDGSSRGLIKLAIAPISIKDKSESTSESFQIVARADGSVTISGADAQGVLWGVRDFIHYQASEWIQSLKAGQPLVSSSVSAPTLQHRGLWSWWYGCWDPYAYIDRASEWKLNTVTFWNRGVPLDAERLNAYAHERGVKIWWGFSWGWVADDFKDASPDLAKRLLAIYERQKKEIGAGLTNLCPQDPETPQALLDYVLDVFEHQYAWIPNIDGIYFQTATESTCPCPKCKAAPRGEGFIRTVLPIIMELHHRYPSLRISCGVHNTGDIETFKALKQIPEYANICWEAGATWAPSREIANDQMTYREANEDFAGIYRITMNCGLVLRGDMIRNQPPRVWLPRIEQLWNYLEEGQPEGSAKGFKTIVVEGQEVGNPCTSDWRPKQNQRLIDNPNFQQLFTWSRDLAKGPAKTKGVFLLVEAGLIDLKMRRVPAMAAETLWDPLAPEEQLEQRCRRIWEKSVGGWHEPRNPFWSAAIGETQGTEAAQPLQDLGNIYREMGRQDKPEANAKPIMKPDTGEPQMFQATGEWTVKQIENRAILAAPPNDLASAGPALQNLEMKLELQIPQGRCGGVVFHYQDPQHFDVLNFYADAAMVFWYRNQNGKMSVVDQKAIKSGLKCGLWYPVKITVQDDQLNVAVQGQEILQSKAEHALAGRYGFRTEGNPVLYRAVQIKSLDGSQPGNWQLVAQVHAEKK